MSERFTAEMTMQEPTPLALIWYRRLGMTPPLRETSDPVADRGRLIPYRFRRFHQVFAATHGYFWIPCPLCDRPFGGHEWGGSIPDPTRAPSGEVGICSQCTIERNGGSSL